MALPGCHPYAQSPRVPRRETAEGWTVGASAAATGMGSVLMRGPADPAGLLIRLRQLQTQPRKATCLY